MISMGVTSLATVYRCQHIPRWLHSSSQVANKVRTILTLDNEQLNYCFQTVEGKLKLAMMQSWDENA